jgi:hypothetical protein
LAELFAGDVLESGDGVAGSGGRDRPMIS